MKLTFILFLSAVRCLWQIRQLEALLYLPVPNRVSFAIVTWLLCSAPRLAGLWHGRNALQTCWPYRPGAPAPTAHTGASAKPFLGLSSKVLPGDFRGRNTRDIFTSGTVFPAPLTQPLLSSGAVQGACCL